MKELFSRNLVALGSCRFVSIKCDLRVPVVCASEQ